MYLNYNLNSNPNSSAYSNLNPSVESNLNMESNNNSRISEISDINSFKKFLNNPIVVVDVYADWCVPCKKLMPRYENLSVTPGFENVIFFKDNIDNPNTVHKKFINAVPTFYIYFEGRLHPDFTKGINDFNELQHVLTNIVNTYNSKEQSFHKSLA